MQLLDLPRPIRPHHPDDYPNPTCLPLGNPFREQHPLINQRQPTNTRTRRTIHDHPAALAADPPRLARGQHRIANHSRPTNSTPRPWARTHLDATARRQAGTYRCTTANLHATAFTHTRDINRDPGRCPDTDRDSPRNRPCPGGLSRSPAAPRSQAHGTAFTNHPGTAGT
ncbi:hypothetical protein V5P93_001012 [Actinokineospora auranticolor]|uniref:Uncharacterized protein n=1 Tax=Actinokineospora auranticolor TaxID=155976 RepID=A0A2S6GY77_9PSEU|nr:hypothetical protein [Actinokineospora auranticolor]PPK70111.1 hypothetical protein CLV40_10221 [Actinokineospora auranticolor]